MSAKRPTVSFRLRRKRSELVLHELTKTPPDKPGRRRGGHRLELLDVHVNRAPVTGWIFSHRHHKGGFRSLKRAKTSSRTSA